MNKYQYTHVDPISEEHVVLVDTDNNVLGVAPKATVHTMDTPLHRAFSSFLFNSKGELLLQQRSSKKKTWPLVWSNTCCGHPALHELTEYAVVRRLAFELGITGVTPILMIDDFQYRAERMGVVEHEICPVYVGYYEGTPAFNPDEVESVRWIGWSEFQQEIQDQPGKYSEWCEWEVERLVASENFNNWYQSILA